MTVGFELLNCGECGIDFYAPAHWVKVRRDWGDHGKEFYCPNGHCRVWRTPEIDTIRRERDRLKQQAAQLEDEKRNALAVAERALAETRRVKKRAQAALCPCCNRHFRQLAAHMKNKHPEIVQLPERKKA